MAGAWNEGNWGVGNFGQQNNVTVIVTSVVDNPIAWNQSLFGNGNWGGEFNNIPISLSNETVVSEVNIGWGSDGWGIENWGESGSSVVLSGNLIEIGIGGPGNNWGELNWNSSATQWGGITTTSIAIGQQINLTGLQLDTSLNSVSFDITADANPTGLQINISQGQADANPDAEITGQQINISSPGNVTITAEINSGWGRLGWGIYDWGSDGLSTVISIDNTNLPLTINSGITEYWGQDAWGASTTEWGGSSVTQVNIDVTAEVNSTINAGWGQVAWGTQDWGQGELTINLNIAEGEVDPSPDATVTGIGMTIDLAVGTVVIGTGNVTLTGEQLNITQGDVIGDANTIASVTGIGLNTAVGTVFAGATAEINVTGNGLTITLNSINNQIWTEINTGTDATWIEIDTAA
jgi:hypothetical protein